MRVALYCRVSTEEQSKYGLSLAEQEKCLTEYATNHQYTVAGTYIDAGISARKKYTKRPELLRLLDAVQADKIDLILFIKLDRWFRNIADYYEVQKILDEHHVTWQATEEDYETVTASGRFKVNIMLSVAQDEADRTGERIKFVLDGKKERNEPAGRLPYGYAYSGKSAEIVPEQAQVVKTMFDMYVETGAPYKVIRALNLDYDSFNRMISNHSYCGFYRGVTIPQIVPEEEFNRAQELRHHNARKTTESRVYLFSGMLFCPLCGARMGARHVRKVQYYSCAGRKIKTTCANSRMVREDYIEEYLLTHIDSKVQLLIQSGNSGKSYKPQRDAIERKLSRLSELYINELIGIEDYKKQYADLNAELKAVPQDEPARHARERFFPDWQSMYKELPAEDKRAFWLNTIERIELNPDNSIHDISLK